MRNTPRLLLALLALLAATPAACGYRPARFADAPAVAEVADDAPIPVPERLDPMKELHAVEAYVHRPAVLALDPARPPTAGDVNAQDEVPRSSWFDPHGEGRDREDGPPILPLVVITAEPESGQGGLSVIDARRIRYEIARGPDERPEIRSAGAAITSRLLNAVGWRAPEVHVVTIARADLHASTAEAWAAADTFMQSAPLSGGSRGAAPLSAVRRIRVRALRWPIGIDVGPTPVTGTRDGDPNDRVPHTERRTLRALKLALFWVGSARLDRNALRDAYLGMPGQGYLTHWIVGLDDALGVNAIYDEPNALLGGEGRYLDGNALTALVTLGLGLRHPPPLQTRWPALGDFDERALPESFRSSPPFEPIDRILPADAYWAAKRIAAVPDDVVARAVVAAKMSDAGSAARAVEVLLARRASILASGLRQVTPAEVSGTTASHLVLRDEAIARGVEPATKTEYVIEYLDTDGVEAAPPRRIAPQGASIDVPLPAPGPDYLVVRALAVRRGRPAPRACEVHLVRDHGGARVVGVRH